MNPNLYHVVPSGAWELFSFFDYNVDMGMREEKYEHTKWKNRAQKVATLIQSYDPDIICLQELRQIPGYEPSRSFLAKYFPQYDYSSFKRNPCTKTFHQVTLWKPEKFFCVEQKCFWLSDTETIVSDTWGTAPCGTVGYGYIMTATKLQYIYQNNGESKIVALDDGTIPCVWICNTHLGQEEYLKTKSCEKILEILRSITNDLKDPFILCGDFNMFPDLDGKKQYQIFSDGQLHPVFPYEHLSSPNGLVVPGTFLGYNHDPFCAREPLVKMSHLDHVFINPIGETFKSINLWGQEVVTTQNKGLNVFDPAVVIVNYDSTKQEEIDALHDRDSMPSDHLALFVTFLTVF